MGGPAAFLRARANARGIVISAAIVAALMLVVRFALIPAYRDITGFVPFDAQPRLSQVMIGVELGAFEKGAATGAYALFAAIDMLRAVAVAWLFTLIWAWLFAKAPNRVFAFLTRGGILLIPTYTLALDIAAKVGFYRLLQGVSEPNDATMVDYAVMAHRLNFAMIDLRHYLTAAFVVIAVVAVVLQRRKPSS